MGIPEYICLTSIAILSIADTFIPVFNLSRAKSFYEVGAFFYPSTSRNWSRQTARLLNFLGGDQMKFVFKSALIILAVAIVAGIAHAQFSKPEDAIRYRQSNMVLIVHHFKQMGAMVQGKTSYDIASFEYHAKLVHTLSTMPWEAFMTPGSDKGNTDLKSSALKNKDEFMKAAKDFENASKDLLLAAAGGNVSRIKTEFGTTAQSCKACHSQFRK